MHTVLTLEFPPSNFKKSMGIFSGEVFLTFSVFAPHDPLPHPSRSQPLPFLQRTNGQRKTSFRKVFFPTEAQGKSFFFLDIFYYLFLFIYFIYFLFSSIYFFFFSKKKYWNCTDFKTDKVISSTSLLKTR